MEAKNFYFRFGNLHVARRQAAHCFAMRFAKGIWGHVPPPRKFFKLVRFGVYFYPILSLKFPKNCHFLYNKINILDTRLLWGVTHGEIF